MRTAFLETIFCDDVRTEVGHKISHMGVYGSNFLVQDFPATVPKICVVMLLHLPEDTAARSAAFTVLRNEEEIGSSTASIEDARRAAMPPREIGGVRYLALRFIAQMSPILLEGPCRLVARAKVDGEIVPGGTLLVERVPEG